MNKKFSTLFAAFLVASSSFSIFAQNAVPEWYKTGPDAYKDKFQAPTADELKAAAKFNLLDGDALTHKTHPVSMWKYTLPLNKVADATLLPGMYVSFDSDKDPVAGGSFLSTEEFYNDVNKPHYGVVTVDGFNYLGIRPTREVKGRAEFVFDTRGLTDATSFHFWISRLENINANRNVTWNIATAQVFELDGTRRGDLPYDMEYATGFKVDKNGVTVGGNTAKAYQVMFNATGNGKVNIDNAIIRVVLESKYSAADNSESEDTLEPVTLFGDINFDFIRPSVEIDYKENAYRVGVNRSTDCEASVMDVKIFKFNDLEKGLVAPMGDKATYLKLNVKEPIVLTKIGNTAVTDGNFAQKVEADGSRSFYVRADLFNVFKPADWSNVVVTYHVEPGTEVDQWPLADYVFATTTASSTDTAFVKHSVDARGTFAFGDDLVFTKYEEVLETSIDFSYLPKFVTNGEYLRDENGVLDLTLLTPADPNATDRWEDKIEFLGFNWYKDGVLQEKHENIIPTDAVDCVGNLVEGWTVKAAFHFASEDMNIDQNESYNIEEKWGLTATLNAQDDLKGYSGQNLIDLGASYYKGDLTTSARTQHIWTRWEGIETDNGVVGSATGTLADAMNISKALINAAQRNPYYSCGDCMTDFVTGAEIFAAPYFTNKISETQWGIEGSSRTHVVRIHAMGLKPDADDAKFTTVRLYKQAMKIGDEKIAQDKNFYFSTDYPNASWNRGDIAGNDTQLGTFWRGESINDTLFIRIPYTQKSLDDLKNNGIPVKVKYTPQSAMDLLPTQKLFTGLAQFGLLSNDSGNGIPEDQFDEEWKKDLTGFNQFNVLGTISKGVVSTLTGDRPVGAYTSLLDNIQRIDQWEPGRFDSNVFRDLYTKNYGTYYLGQDQCYEVKDGSFVIAGLNLIAPVAVETSKSNKIGAFDHDTTVVIGRLENGQLIPNKYGELLAYVKSTFKPSDKAGIVADTIHSAVDNKDFIYNYVQDTVRIYPVQIYDRSNWTYVYGLDEKYTGAEDCSSEESDGYFNLFNIYGAYRNDTVAANIYGDVKQPELYFSTEADTKAAKMTKLDFGAVTFTAEDIAANKTIYLIGKDLPALDPNSAVSSEIALNPAGELIAIAKGANEAKYVSEAIIPVSVDLMADKSDHELITDMLSASTLCDCAVELPVNYTPVLSAPVVDTKHLADNINGSKAEFRWSEVPGAHYYKVELGQYQTQKTSKNVFISEVKAEDGSIMVELFNGTGVLINPLLHHNYRLDILKNGVEFATLPDVVSTNSQLNEPYKAAAFSFDAELSLDNTYTVKLMEGGKQIDIFEFSNTTRLSRDEKDGRAENTGAFDKNDWNPHHGSLPVASYNEESPEWDFKFVQGIESENVASTSTSIRAIGLKPQTEYAVRVTAYSNSPAIVKSAGSEIAEFGTSLFSESDDNLAFDEDSYETPTGNEDISVDGVQVYGGKASVTIKGAANKTVVITNILGQTVANKLISSDNEQIEAPAGIVVVAVEGQAAVKAIVK